MSTNFNQKEKIELLNENYNFTIITSHIFSYISSWIVYSMFDLNINILYIFLIIITSSLLVALIAKNNYYLKVSSLIISLYIMVYFLILIGLRITDLSFILLQLILLVLNIFTLIYTFYIMSKLDFTSLANPKLKQGLLLSNFVKNNIFFRFKTWLMIGVPFLFTPIFYLINITVAKVTMVLMFLLCLLSLTSFTCFLIVFLIKERKYYSIDRM